MRTWIEVYIKSISEPRVIVTLYMRAWIEVLYGEEGKTYHVCRPLHEGVD